ncbi:MAG: rRNA maturation RNase YbeY [Bacteroidota bacterium]
MNDNSINFFSEEIEFELSNPDVVRAWIKKVITTHQKVTGDINYIFCRDQYLHNINMEYLSHDTYTDIITFDHSEEEVSIAGDIYISIDRVSENAKKFEVTDSRELHRVMIHGILHLIGFTDHSKKEKEIMREKEVDCLSLLTEN